MSCRVVLGWTPETRALVERLTATGDLLVVTDEAGAIEWLAEREVRAERADPTDPSALAGLADDVSGVTVVAADPTRTDALVAAARAAYPDAAVVSLGAGTRVVDAESDANRVVDPTAALAARALGHVASPAGERALSLRATLRELEEPVAVLTHDNPDPDAIASAVALTHLAGAVGVEAQPCYFGEIAHQENRALVNLLELDLRQLEGADELASFGGLALVDHARPGVNDSLPPETPVDVVIDHHPTDGPDAASFVDLRSGVGATSTLLTEYYDRLDLTLSETVATALLYGLRVDTDDFTREAAPADFEAAAALVGRADHGILERVESPTVSTETLSVLARAIERRQRHDGVLTAGVGEVTDRDALAQAADRLLDLDGVTTTVVFGIKEGTVYVSARARGAAIDLGDTLRTAYDRLGSAGGHAEMAGAQIPLGMLVEPEDDDPVTIVEEVLTGAFLEAVQTTYAPPIGEFAGDREELSFLATGPAGRAVVADGPVGAPGSSVATPAARTPADAADVTDPAAQGAGGAGDDAGEPTDDAGEQTDDAAGQTDAGDAGEQTDDAAGQTDDADDAGAADEQPRDADDVDDAADRGSGDDVEDEDGSQSP